MSTAHLDHRYVFDSSPNPCAVLSRDLVVIDANPSYVGLFNLSRNELVGRVLLEALPSRLEEAGAELLASFMHVIEQGMPHSIPLLRYPVSTDDDQRDRFWTVTNTPLLDDSGTLIGILNCPIEVTSLLSRGNAEIVVPSGYGIDQQIIAGAINHHLEGERRRFRQLMQQAPGFVAVGRGPTHVFELANNAYYQLIGHRDIVGKPVRQALPELVGQGFYELLDEVYRSGKPFIGRAMPIFIQPEPNAPLKERYIDFIYQPILDEEGAVSGIFVQGHDVTEAHSLSQRVAFQAAHDPLTGLLNRREFEARLNRAVADGADGSRLHSLIYLDLDQFKVVNDTCGHAAGDELLRQVSLRLKATVDASGTVARLGGDEFGILLEGVHAPESHAIAERLRQTIDSMEFSWERRIFGCSASLGVVTLDTAMGNAADALSAADSACFMAKERGRNRVQIHCLDDSDILARRREMDWVIRLRSALAQGRLMLFAQRILPTKPDSRKTPLRMELLLRLEDEDGTIVPPMAFIPAAERFGLMHLLDRLVLKKAFDKIASLSPRAREGVDLSINLSGSTLSDDWLLPYVKERLEADASLAGHICFEVTETSALQHLSRTIVLMLELKELGFRFALDDFGSGMSSLSYLKQLPVDYLKIDGVFIRQITSNAADAAMVEAMAKVASVMGIRTVAEYVDSEPTRRLLESLNIDYIQGFSVHVPEPFDVVMRSHAMAWQDL